MARPLRYEPAASLWHVTNRGNEQQDIFRDDEDREIFLDLIRKCVTRFSWLLSVYTLMTNHYHLTIELTEDGTLSRGMHVLDGRYAQLFNQRYSRAGHLFQGTYGGQCVEKETYFLNVARYTILNPVRAGMCQRPEDYKWSSYRATAGLDPAPRWLACEEVLRMMGDRDNAHAAYADFVARGADVNPWSDLIGQMFLGSKEWMAEIRNQLGDEPLDHEFPLRQRRVGRSSMDEVIGAVSAVTGVPAETIRKPRGGPVRTIAAWIGFHEGLLRLREIAGSLGFRSVSGVTNLVKQCEQRMRLSDGFRKVVEECVSTLRRR